VTQLRLALNQAWLERYFGENKSERLFSKGGVRIASHRPTAP